MARATAEMPLAPGVDKIVDGLIAAVIALITAGTDPGADDNDPAPRPS